MDHQVFFLKYQEGTYRIPVSRIVLGNVHPFSPMFLLRIMLTMSMAFGMYMCFLGITIALFGVEPFSVSTYPLALLAVVISWIMFSVWV